LAGGPRRENQTERQQFFKQESRSQHLAQRLDTFSRQVNLEIFLALIQPETLQEHEESSNMVGMQMGDKDLIDQIGTQAGGFEAAADGFPTIDQQRSFPKAVEVRRMVAVDRSRPIAHPETSQTKRLHVIDTNCSVKTYRNRETVGKRWVFAALPPLLSRRAAPDDRH